MLTNHPAWAQPGCFGQALTFNENLAECSSCPFAGECKIASAAALQRLRDHHGIVVHRKGMRTKPASTATSSAALTLPKKVEELLQRIERAGVRVSEALKEKRNPFGRDFPFLRITAHLLLAVPFGVTREHLVTGFEQRLNWSKGTAAAHATQAFQALIALGVAEEIEGRLNLKRTG